MRIHDIITEKKVIEVAGPKDCWDGKAPGAQTGVKTKDIGGDMGTVEFTKQITDNL